MVVFIVCCNHNFLRNSWSLRQIELLLLLVCVCSCFFFLSSFVKCVTIKCYCRQNEVNTIHSFHFISFITFKWRSIRHVWIYIYTWDRNRKHATWLNGRLFHMRWAFPLKSIPFSSYCTTHTHTARRRWKRRRRRRPPSPPPPPPLTHIFRHNESIFSTHTHTPLRIRRNFFFDTKTFESPFHG